MQREEMQDLPVDWRNRQTPTVLVVDDTPDNLVLVSELLGDHYRVKVANSGARALKAAQTDPVPDLVLLDIMMPEMDGYEVLDHLKADPLTRHIPVIFLTALNAEEDEERGLQQGAVDYLTKPIRPQVALARIRTHLELARARRDLRTQNERLEALVTFRTRQLQAAAQELAMAREAIAAASRAKTDFLSTVSHELRTPLNGIMGMAQLLQFRDLDIEAHNYLDIIIRSSETLTRVIDSILEFSALNRARPELHRVEFGLRELLEKTLSNFKYRCAEKGLLFRLEISPQLPVRLGGDSALLAKALAPLLDNALKFTRSGSIQLSAEGSDGEDGKFMLRLTLGDTGIGIAPDVLSRIFEPFVQVETGYSRTYEGTGLGLALARARVEQLGGQIGCESQPGRGSHFWILVPLDAIPAA